MKGHYVYFLRCADGTIYCGYALDPRKRLAMHNAAKGAKYTRTRLPVTLVYLEKFQEKGEALKRECALKKLTRAQKIAFIDAHPYHGESDE